MVFYHVWVEAERGNNPLGVSVVDEGEGRDEAWRSYRTVSSLQTCFMKPCEVFGR